MTPDLLTDALSSWGRALLLGGAVYLLLLALGRLLKRRARVPLSWTYQIVALSLAVYAAQRLLHRPLPGGREVAFAGLILASFPLNAVLYRWFWPVYGYPGEKARVPGFLPQVVAILLFVSFFLLGLGVFYGVTVGGLLAGSGLIAIILGLALQDTLGNIFAGFGLQAGRAFRVGDYLLLQGQPVQVMEITWRSTRFRNNDEVSFSVPNSHLAKETIVNLYYPTRVHAMRFRVTVDGAEPPNRVKAALERCATGTDGVLSHPAPRAFFAGFEESGLAYELKYWIDNAACHPQISDAIRTRCWYEFGRKEIAWGMPSLLLSRGRSPGARRSVPPLDLLEKQALFATLDAEQLRRVALEARTLCFGNGETMVERGAPGGSMFILASGAAEVLGQRDGKSVRVGTLAAGDCFGEMSLLTGEPRSATVRADGDCAVVEIPKSAMRTLLREQPSLAERLSDTLVARRNATERSLAQAATHGNGERHLAERESLLRRLRVFFEL